MKQESLFAHVKPTNGSALAVTMALEWPSDTPTQQQAFVAECDRLGICPACRHTRWGVGTDGEPALLRCRTPGCWWAAPETESLSMSCKRREREEDAAKARLQRPPERPAGRP